MNNIIKFINNRKNFVLYSILRVLIMTLGLVTNIIIVRKLQVNQFGIFSIALMLIGLITTFGFSWSSSSILYFGSKERAKFGSINKTFWARNIIIFFSLIISTILFLIFNNYIDNYIGQKLSLLLLFWLYVKVAEDYLTQYFLAVKKQLLASILSLTAKVLYISLIMLISFDVRTLIILNIISHSIVLLFIVAIKKQDIGKFEFDKKWFKKILNFSLWQLFGFSGIYLINFGDIAVIKYFMTVDDVGYYNAAYRLFEAVAAFSFIIINYFTSSVSDYFVNNDYRKIREFYYKERLYIFGLSFIFHVLLIMFSKTIIITFYGGEYTESVIIFNILIIGSIFRYLAVFYTLYYNTNNKYKILQLINIIRAILNVILDIILINIFGLIGPAIATTIALILTFLFSMYYCEKRISLFAKKANSQLTANQK